MAPSEALIVGSVALDTVETPHGRVEDVLGGSAAFGSVAASYFAPTALVAVVGKDFPAKDAKTLASRGINLEGLEYQDGLTFRWSGYYQREMANAYTNTTCLNVFETFRPKLTALHAKSRFVFLANIHPSLQLYVVKQLQNPELVALDSMNYWIEGSKRELTQVMRRCSLLLVNEEEARHYCETTSLIEAGQSLLRLGPSTVVIKKGEHGALVFQKDHIMAVPAYPLAKLKDPTGAGDTFAGSLTGYVARMGKATDENIRRAVFVGSLMASFAVEDFSLRRLLRIKPGEIEERAARLRGMMIVPRINHSSLNGAV
ncbi:sugar kinase [Candidatus Poribacteria bacterium]|nr:sugar kinase [Candidatus Poribacteria bacterium]